MKEALHEKVHKLMVKKRKSTLIAWSRTTGTAGNDWENT